MKTNVPTVSVVVASSAGSPGAAAPQLAHPPVKRMDVINQTLLLFIHSKWTMCPDHHFAFTSLGDTISLGYLFLHKCLMQFFSRLARNIDNISRMIDQWYIQSLI
ncbi:hypothetical protein GUJ93_ZPchr0007g4985 [Zizania palustris]|uniref:Uncharacterized protein n=1 Tax=Zizania palustris TaxID=103762 RepID=A0A8J5SJ07_ZIZPA|nr:hypothetical protein GUJ93_ZPchr0007g4985 [Zizania palustris]